MAAEFRLPIIRNHRGLGRRPARCARSRPRAAPNLPGGVGGRRHLRPIRPATWRWCRWFALGPGFGRRGWAPRGWRRATYSVMTKSSAMFRRRPRRWWRGSASRRPACPSRTSRRSAAGETQDAQRRGRRRGRTPRDEAFAWRRAAFLSYLPELGLRHAAGSRRANDTADRRDAGLDGCDPPRSPQSVFSCGPIVEAVVDRGSFFEMGKMFGRSLVTGLARLDGPRGRAHGQRPACITAAPGRRIPARRRWRFIDLAQNPSTCPIVYLLDCPGLPDRASRPNAPPRSAQRRGARMAGDEPVHRAVVAR